MLTSILSHEQHLELSPRPNSLLESSGSHNARLAEAAGLVVPLLQASTFIATMYIWNFRCPILDLERGMHEEWAAVSSWTLGQVMRLTAGGAGLLPGEKVGRALTQSLMQSSVLDLSTAFAHRLFMYYKPITI